MPIVPFEPRHLEGVVGLSLRAWAPVFVSLKEVFEPAVFDAFYPGGWLESQKKAVEDVCATPGMNVWVAEVNPAAPAEKNAPPANPAPSVAGFVAVRKHDDGILGEIYMIAVDPDHQQRGIGVELTNFAVDWMKSAGLSVAMVETGSDPGHAPARRLYEKSGFRLFAASRYFMKL
jgi:ribosomal protein S18 acetylase RimI-like enzyme